MTTTTVTCPLCSRQLNVKTTSKLGRHIPRHGHRGIGGGGACAGSLLDADNPLPGAIKEQERTVAHWALTFEQTGKPMHRDSLRLASEKLERLQAKLPAPQKTVSDFDNLGVVFDLADYTE